MKLVSLFDLKPGDLIRFPPNLYLWFQEIQDQLGPGDVCLFLRCTERNNMKSFEFLYQERKISIDDHIEDKFELLE